MCYHFYMAHSEHEKYSYYFGSIQTLPNMLLWFMSEAVVVTPWKSEPLTATCREQSVSTRCPASSHGMLNKQSIYISHPLSSSLWNCFLSTQLCQKAAASSLFSLQSSVSVTSCLSHLAVYDFSTTYCKWRAGSSTYWLTGADGYIFRKLTKC